MDPHAATVRNDLRVSYFDRTRAGLDLISSRSCDRVFLMYRSTSLRSTTAVSFSVEPSRADAPWWLPYPTTNPRDFPQWLLASVLLVSIKVYQVVISPFFVGSCRFFPSCSVYAAEAIAHYGTVQGAWLAMRRLGRCHPLCEGGFDPVPGLKNPVEPDTRR